MPSRLWPVEPETLDELSSATLVMESILLCQHTVAIRHANSFIIRFRCCRRRRRRRGAFRTSEIKGDDVAALPHEKDSGKIEDVKRWILARVEF